MRIRSAGLLLVGLLFGFVLARALPQASSQGGRATVGSENFLGQATPEPVRESVLATTSAAPSAGQKQAAPKADDGLTGPWIRVVNPHKYPNLANALRKTPRPPQEYFADVPGVSGSITMSHSLIPGALHHAFSEFAVLISPELPLSRRDHELIAATVSALNQCHY